MSVSTHICHITTVHPAYDVRIFHKECKSLQRAGNRVTLLVANGPTETTDGVEVIGVEVPYSGRLSRIRKTSKALLEKAFELDADVYHFHDPEFLKSGLKLQQAGKQVIYDIHEDVPRQILAKGWIPSLVRGSVSRRFEKLENKVAAQLSHLCPATPFIRDRFLPINANTTDICNYPILDEWKDLPPRDTATTSVCYVGGITAVRGIREMVDALAGTNITMELAGKFESQALRDEVANQAGWANVKFNDFLDRAGVAALYSRSQIGLVTLHPIINYKDALPVKLFEYMAAGLPVIASNFPVWKNIVEKHECGVCVDPLNPEAIREAMQDLLADPEKAQQMGENGRKAVHAHYNWHQEAEKLIAVYAKLANERGARG